MRRPTEQQWYVGALAVIAIIAAFLVIMASTAAAGTAIFEEPSQTRIPNGQHQIHWTFSTAHKYQGCLATIEVSETNEGQPSAHPGNQLVAAIDGREIARLDIETGRGGSSVTTVQETIGDVFEVWYEFGPDNVTSSGFAVSITCQEEPSTTTTETPVTTTVPATTSTTQPALSTTTTQPVVTTTSEPPSPVTSTTTPPSGPTTTSTTLPPTPTGVPTGEGPPPDSLAVVTLGGAAVMLAGLVGLSVWTYRRMRHEG